MTDEGLDIVDGVDLFDGDDDTPLVGAGDPISEAVGVEGYIESYQLDDCVQTFDSGAYTEPCRFDRYYFHADPLPGEPPRSPYTPLLVDLVGAAEGPDREIQEQAKRTEFKREWCAAHGWRYVVLYDFEAATSDTLEERLSYSEQLGRALGPEIATKADENAEKTPKRATPARTGGIQRPKAAAK